MRAFRALLKRELWEHPSICWGPVLVGGVATLSALVVLLRTSGLWGGLILSLEGDTSLGDRGAAGALTSLLLPLFALTVALVVTFYLLDSLYSERRERTVLFFRSMPVSDLATVLSKLVTGIVVAPLLGWGALVLTELAVLVVATLIGLAAGHPVGLLWSATDLGASFAHALSVAIVAPLWYAPLAAYLLAVSAWARRGVLLWACAPLLLVQLEFLLTGGSLLGRLIVARLTGFFSATLGRPPAELLHSEDAHGAFSLSLSSLDAPLSVLARPGFWVGLLVAAVFTAAAVSLRRFRDAT